VSPSGPRDGRHQPASLPYALMCRAVINSTRASRSVPRSLEQRSGSRVVSDVASLGRLGCARNVSAHEWNVWTRRMDLERLVDELWCGNHGLGDVSRFLLRALDNDESAAREEFSKFLQGKLSDRLIRLSRLAVGADGQLQTDGRLHRHRGSLRARGVQDGRQQTTSPRRSLVRGGHDRAAKTASTVPTRARKVTATSSG
jgi:hypothetical protein